VSADLELGKKVHELLGIYLPKIGPCAAEERHRLLAELAGKLYDVHASKRLEFVRPGHLGDCNVFDGEHPIRAYLAVWQPLENVSFDYAERQTIEFALAGARSHWLKEAIQKANAEMAPVPVNTAVAQSNSKTARVQQWGDIEVIFLSDERVQIKIGAESETRNYAEMGFASKKNGAKVQA
jgi:hypothetical protein